MYKRQPEAIEEVAFQLTKVATERIDMNHHKGEHKRMGATDVIPLVPQSKDVTVEECVEMLSLIHIFKRYGDSQTSVELKTYFESKDIPMPE